MDPERRRREGTGERGRGGEAPSTPLAQEWQEWGGTLLGLWDHARRAEPATGARRRHSDCDPALRVMMEAARPEWPADDRVRFIHAQLTAFRALGEDAEVRAEMVRRGMEGETAAATLAALRDIAAVVDLADSQAAAQAVVAGLVGRYGGARRRAGYILDAVVTADPITGAGGPGAEERRARAADDTPLALSPPPGAALRALLRRSARVSRVVAGLLLPSPIR